MDFFFSLIMKSKNIVFSDFKPDVQSPNLLSAFAEAKNCISNNISHTTTILWQQSNVLRIVFFMLVKTKECTLLHILLINLQI